MDQREPWLRERSQVLALLESAEYAALNAGWETDRTADMAETVVAWMATQPTQLRVGVQMGLDSDEGDVPLPEAWWQMTAAEREHWADESLQVHVANVVNAWWDVKTADGKSAGYDLDAVAEQE